MPQALTPRIDTAASLYKTQHVCVCVYVCVCVSQDLLNEAGPIIEEAEWEQLRVLLQRVQVHTCTCTAYDNTCIGTCMGQVLHE